MIADQHTNLGRTIDGPIVHHLQRLRAEIKAHIKVCISLYIYLLLQKSNADSEHSKRDWSTRYQRCYRHRKGRELSTRLTVSELYGHSFLQEHVDERHEKGRLVTSTYQHPSISSGASFNREYRSSIVLRGPCVPFKCSSMKALKATAGHRQSEIESLGPSIWWWISLSQGGGIENTPFGFPVPKRNGCIYLAEKMAHA